MTRTRPSSQSGAWTTRALLEWIEPHLQERGVAEPLLVARWLVAHAIGTDPIHLYTDPDRPASEAERQTLRSLVSRASEHEPVQYLLGEAGFLGRTFAVGPGVLIPRTATETLVQHVLTWHRGIDAADRPSPLRIADIGTGSGAIGVTLALHLQSAHVTAVDVSPDAVACARVNATRHNMVDRVEVQEGDLCEPLRQSSELYHVIVSNPPYLSDARWDQAAPNVRDHEPALALRGGGDGLDVIRRLLAEAPSLIEPGGLLMIELDDHHAAEACALAAACGSLGNCRVIRDEFGDDRFLVADRVD